MLNAWSIRISVAGITDNVQIISLWRQEFPYIRVHVGLYDYMDICRKPIFQNIVKFSCTFVTFYCNQELQKWAVCLSITLPRKSCCYTLYYALQGEGGDPDACYTLHIKHVFSGIFVTGSFICHLRAVLSHQCAWIVSDTVSGYSA